MIVTNQARNYSILKQNSAIMYIFRIFNNEMTIILHSGCHCRLQILLFCRFPKPYRQKKSRFQPAGYGVRRPWNACATAAVRASCGRRHMGMAAAVQRVSACFRRSKEREEA